MKYSPKLSPAKPTGLPTSSPQPAAVKLALRKTRASCKTGLSVHKRSNSTAVLVGPGKHFGAELVSRLADICSDVLVVSRDPSPFVLGHRVTGLSADLADLGSFESLLSAKLGVLPPVRIVIYNAKSSPVGHYRDVSSTDFAECLALNVAGAFAVVKVVERSTDGEVGIVLTGGGFKDNPDESRLALSVSKAGLHSLSLGLGRALNQSRIRVKTLVIDGVVRRTDSTLNSSDVANEITKLALDPHLQVARYDPLIQVSKDQLTLFAGFDS